MRREAIRTERRALGTLNDEDIDGVVQEVLETHDEDPEEVTILHAENLEQDDDIESGSLVIHRGEAPPSLRRRAAANGATAWDQEDLVREVGRAALVQLGADFDLQLNQGEEGIIASPINVERKKALQVAKPYTNKNPSAILEMTPYRVYDYEVDCAVRDDEVDEEFQAKGTAALNLAKQELTDLELDETVTLPLSESGEVLQHDLDEDESEKLVKELLAQDMGRDVRLQKEKRQTQVYEKRTVEPPLDELNVDEPRLIYRGNWTVKGGGTDVIIDATTGDVLHPETKGGAELV